jgi:hypothetical protein
MYKSLGVLHGERKLKAAVPTCHPVWMHHKIGKKRTLVFNTSHTKGKSAKDSEINPALGPSMTHYKHS